MRLEDLLATPDPDPTPEVPSKHWLVVREEWDEEDDGLEVEHVGCKRFEPYEGVEDWDCGVGFEISNAGLRTYFAHRDDPDHVLDSYLERLPPGRYEIEHWTHTYPAGPWGSEEYDGGIRTVET